MNTVQGNGPMEGVTIIDLTQIYNGPYATYLAAMAGARVIKIEPPGGEHLRKRSATSGAALPFALLNGNKESLVLDLKSEDGQKLLLELIEHADVLVENFAPGVMDRLGIGPEIVRQRNPRLVYASGSGYGSTGPYRNYPAMDLTIQAMSGAMSITGFADGPPLKAGPAICDFFGGIHLYAAIATALFDRERTGTGRVVEVSMLEAVYHSLSSSLGMLYQTGADDSPRTGNRHGGMSLAPYNVYPSSDGYVAIICNNDAHWLSLLEVIGDKELSADSRFGTMQGRVEQIDALDAKITIWTKQLTKAAIFEKLIEARVPCAPVRTLREVSTDPHLFERRMLAKMHHPEFGEITVASSPLRYSDWPTRLPRPSPALGQDTHEILQGLLGYTVDEVGRFEQRGAVRSAKPKVGVTNKAGPMEIAARGV